MATGDASGVDVGAGVDRFGGKRSMIFSFLPLVASLLAFLFIATPWVLFFAVALYGFAHGGFFTVVSPTVAEYFGLRAHGAIFGIILFCGVLAGSAGPLLAGRIFDLTGSYDPAFMTLAVASRPSRRCGAHGACSDLAAPALASSVAGPLPLSGSCGSAS